MKKGFFIFVFMCFSISHVYANGRTSRGLTEAQQLGITAGVAQACSVGNKLKTFELIANRIIANPIPSDELEKKELREFAAYKLNAYNSQKNNPVLDCSKVLKKFYKLPIFKSVIYADGSVKLPDGRILKPMRPLKKNKKSK